MRVVVYRADGGERLGILPEVLSVQLTIPLSDMPTLALSVPELGVGASVGLLDERVEVAVEVSTDGQMTWEEPPGARFTVIKTTRHLLPDGTQAQRVEAVHVSEALRRGIIWNVTKAIGWGDNGGAIIHGGTAGEILYPIWERTQQRGWGHGLSLAGSEATDADGIQWGRTGSLEGQSIRWTDTLSTIVDLLTERGLIDVEWHGRQMRPTVPLSREAATLQVSWPLGDGGTTVADETVEWQDMATHVMVLGAGGLGWQIPIPGASGPRREVSVESNQVTTEEGARRVAEEVALRRVAPAEEVVREWRGETARLLPWRDYRPGQWMMVERRVGRTLMQVTQVSVTVDADGVTGHTTFGTVLEDMATRAAKSAARAQAGTVTSTASSPVVPTPEGSQTPRTIRAAEVRVDAITTERADGTIDGHLDITWPAVTTDTAGQQLRDSVDHYEVWIGVAPEGTHDLTHGYAQAAILTPTGTSVTWEGALPGRYYGVWVRPVTSDWRAALWDADAVGVDVEWRPTPPPAPTAPILTSAMGVITVTWDGRTSTAAPVSGRVDRWEVSAVGPGHQVGDVVATVTGRTRGAVQVPATAGEEWSVAIRLHTVDGLVSTWSQVVTTKVDSAIDMDDLIRRLSEGEALQDAAKRASQGLLAETQEMQDLITRALSGTPYPPDDGTPGSTIWVGPDGEVYRLLARP